MKRAFYPPALQGLRLLGAWLHLLFMICASSTFNLSTRAALCSTTSFCGLSLVDDEEDV